MKIIFITLLSLTSRGFCGVLYHRQHAALNNQDYFPEIGAGSHHNLHGPESLRVIKITRTFAVPVPIPVPYTKEIPIPVAVPKPIPYPVPHPIPIPVHKALLIPHAVPYPVPIDHLSPPATNEESQYDEYHDQNNFHDENYHDSNFPQNGFSQQDSHGH